MSNLIWIVLLAGAGLAVQTLSVGLKLRLAFTVAHWSALMLIAVRLAAYALAQAEA